MILDKLKSLRYECVGCGNCVKNCANNALSLKIDEEGFLTAVLDEKRCKDCKKCIDICPQK